MLGLIQGHRNPEAWHDDAWGEDGWNQEAGSSTIGVVRLKASTRVV